MQQTTQPTNPQDHIDQCRNFQQDLSRIKNYLEQNGKSVPPFLNNLNTELGQYVSWAETNTSTIQSVYEQTHTGSAGTSRSGH